MQKQCKIYFFDGFFFFFHHADVLLWMTVVLNLWYGWSNRRYTKIYQSSWFKQIWCILRCFVLRQNVLKIYLSGTQRKNVENPRKWPRHKTINYNQQIKNVIILLWEISLAAITKKTKIWDTLWWGKLIKIVLLVERRGKRLRTPEVNQVLIFKWSRTD